MKTKEQIRAEIVGNYSLGETDSINLAEYIVNIQDNSYKDGIDICISAISAIKKAAAKDIKK
jgi:hypothetical protein